MGILSVFMEDVVTGALIGAAVGAGIGAIASLVYWYVKTGKIKKRFNIGKGMEYEKVISALGEPLSKNEKGNKITCKWNLNIDGKAFKITIIFRNKTLVRIV